MDICFDSIRETVQKNCHISDASHAGNYTLCIYLMKMREYFRWEQRKTFSASLPHETVGSWLREREKLWDQLEDEQFQPLQIENQHFNPFDSDALNQVLEKHQLVYSGGLGINSKPHFFLARLESRHEHNGYTVLVSAEEYARDLTSPPGMTQGKTIFIRRESLKRLLWEKLETWNWNQPDNAMGRALQFYDFKHDLDKALDAMTENELQAMLLHEIGEIKAGEILGEQWEELLLRFPHSKVELMLRAVRDHLADALSTFPALLEENNEASLHFYMGNLNNMRKHLYPGLQSAYQHWLETGKLDALLEQNSIAQSHWQSLCEQILCISSQDQQPQKAIEDLIESRRL
jgi:hypothetical protein